MATRAELRREAFLDARPRRSSRKTSPPLPKYHQPPLPQLLGMADHLTFTLGQHGYGAYK